MGRKRYVKDFIEPDWKYDSKKISKFINYIMIDGEKSTAQNIFYGALNIVENKIGKSGYKVFQKAIQNASPSVEIKSKRVGGATYQVPVQVNEKRKIAIASKWIVDEARQGAGRTMKEDLADILIDTFNNKGAIVNKKKEMHRMAEANKAFAHFA